MFNLLAVTPTTITSISEYVKEQLDAISIAFPALVVEQTNENDERYTSVYQLNTRFPVFMLFEHGVFRTVLIGKVDTQVLIKWLNSCSVNE